MTADHIIVWNQAGGSSQAIPSAEVESERETRRGLEVLWRGQWWRVRSSGRPAQRPPE